MRESTRPESITEGLVMVLGSLVVLVLGGLFESLTTLGIGTFALVLSIGRAWQSNPSRVLRFHLPIATAILLVAGGLYWDLGLLMFAGVLLQIAHAAWVYFRDER